MPFHVGAKKLNISDSELMAEKLGIIVLCNNCGKRLVRTNIARIPIWEHEDTKSFLCDETGVMAIARKGPLSEYYEKMSK